MARAIHCANCSVRITTTQAINGNGLCKLCDGAQTVQAITEQDGLYGDDGIMPEDHFTDFDGLTFAREML